MTTENRITRMTRTPATPPDTLQRYRQAAAADFADAAHIRGGDWPLTDYILGDPKLDGSLSPRTIRWIAEDLGVDLVRADRVAAKAYEAPIFEPCANDSPHFGLAVRGLVAREMGGILAATLCKFGSYIELKFDPAPAWKDRRPCIVTIARNEGATPDAMRKAAEAELQRAITELAKAGISFITDHKSTDEHPDIAAARTAAGPAGLPEDNCRIDYAVDPHELFCTACNARQPMPPFFSESVFQAIADAFYAEHGERRCQK